MGGQVQVIKKKRFECYECRPAPRTKSYAYCTIHNTPSKPIHCIVWAKIKFSDFFSASEPTGDEEELVNDAQMLAEEEALKKELDVSFERWVFRKLFHTDIFKRIRMAEVSSTDIWKGKEPPKPIEPGSIQSLNVTEESTTDDQKVWTFEQNIYKFYQATSKLHKRFTSSGAIEWDKDDDDALDFVTSATNLRSHMFNIPLQSKFETKAMAGNIIPAIATTNAIIAGLIVLEAFKILSNNMDKCKYTYLLRRPSGNRILMDAELEPPSKQCYICSSNQVTVKIDTEQFTVGFLVDEVLRGALGMVNPNLYLGSTNVFESSDDLEEDEQAEMKEQAQKLLKDVGITHNTLVRADDDAQELSIELSVCNQPFEKEVDGEEVAKPKFQIVNSSEPPAPQASGENLGKRTTSSVEDTDEPQAKRSKND